MSVTLVGAEGFFNRQGAFIGEFNRVAGPFYCSALDAGFLSIWLQFASSDQAAVQNLPDAVTAFRQTQQTYLNIIQTDGQNGAVLQVNRDAPLVPYTVVEAFTKIRDQMLDTGQSINRPTLGSSVTPGGSNLGDTTVVVSTTNKYGDPSDMIFAEDVTVTCTSATGGTSFGATLQAVGEPLVAASSCEWPGGSGSNVSFSVCDGGSTVNNLLTEGALTNWTNTDTPTGWSIADGDAGVNVFQDPGGGLRAGTNAAELRSDGASLTELYQAVTLTTNTVYALSMFVARSVSNADGTFNIRLTDGDGNTIQNDAGSNLQFTVSIASLTDSLAIVTAFFSTPRQLPPVVQARYGFSVAPTATRGVFMCIAGMVAATPFYGANSQGPYIAAFAGADRTAVADVYTATFTNSLGSNSFVRGFDRVYSMRNMVNQAGEQVYLPSATSETISDDLVTH